MYMFRTVIVRVFDIIFEFDRYILRARDHLLTFPLGRDIRLESVCRADIWCNQYCAASRGRIRAPKSPSTGPEPLNFQFLLGLAAPPAKRMQQSHATTPQGSRPWPPTKRSGALASHFWGSLGAPRGSSRALSKISTSSRRDLRFGFRRCPWGPHKGAQKCYETVPLFGEGALLL